MLIIYPWKELSLPLSTTLRNYFLRPLIHLLIFLIRIFDHSSS